MPLTLIKAKRVYRRQARRGVSCSVALCVCLQESKYQDCVCSIVQFDSGLCFMDPRSCSLQSGQRRGFKVNEYLTHFSPKGLILFWYFPAPLDYSIQTFFLLPYAARVLCPVPKDLGLQQSPPLHSVHYITRGWFVKILLGMVLILIFSFSVPLTPDRIQEPYAGEGNFHKYVLLDIFKSVLR